TPPPSRGSGPGRGLGAGPGSLRQLFGVGRRFLSLYASLRGDVLFCPGHARATDQSGIPAFRTLEAGHPAAARSAATVDTGLNPVGSGGCVPVGGYGSAPLRIPGGKHHRMEFCPGNGGVLRRERLAVARPPRLESSTLTP